MQHLQPNTTLQGGKYKIERVLGQGGFGITYLAVQVAINRYVAIKEFFIKENCQRDVDNKTMTVPSYGSKQVVDYAFRKFRQETIKLASLSHPNIVRVIDVFEENGTAYYVMDYLPGGSLSDYVKTYGPMSEDWALGYVRQIASALKYMHTEKHMCHLDVKPGNIMLDGKGHALLIDFGISKNYGADGRATSSMPVGLSEGYAPVEQYSQMVSEFSPAIDVYGLGATLYFLLHGQIPVNAPSRVGGAVLQLSEDLSQEVKNIINASMAVSKIDRAQSMDVFLQPQSLVSSFPPPVPDNPISFIHKASGQSVVQPLPVGQTSETTINTSSIGKRQTGRNHELHLKSKMMPRKNGRKWFLLVFFSGVLLLSVFFFAFYNSFGKAEHDYYTFSVNGTEFDMVKVDGITDKSGKTYSYLIGKTEVTIALFESVLDHLPPYVDNTNPDLPVTNLTWGACQIFIEELNKKTGENFRLPTEEEWVYAANGGKSGLLYSGSDDYNDVAWCLEKTHGVRGDIHEVAKLKSNNFGIYDMSGNVWEWCHGSEKSAKYGTLPPLRGGSFQNDKFHSQINSPKSRMLRGDEMWDSSVGLRLAKSIN